jgi:anti-sigma factor RsiW
MNCHEAATLVAAFADGEIDGLRGRSLEKHLQGCAECAAKRDAIVVLRRRLRDEAPYHRAPPALRERLLVALASAPVPDATPPRRANERWRWLATGALAGCAATLCAWMIGTAVIGWQASEDLAVEAATAHVRATLGNHLVEVASSDRHTVKPWLSARLDFSPPVRELPNKGCVLAGGRLDYLDRQHVAVLVYRYRDHVIDVFVRPESSRTSAWTPRSVRGFNVARATGGGMDWVAVSDVNPEVLAELLADLARDGASS